MIFESCEYVIFKAKGILLLDSVKDLEWWSSLDWPGGPHLITRVLKSGEPFPSDARKEHKQARMFRGKLTSSEVGD